MTTALEGGEGSASRTGRSLPPGNTRYPFYRRLGGPQARSEQVRKISPPPRFDPRTVQPVASRYTDHATRHTQDWVTNDKLFLLQFVGVSSDTRLASDSKKFGATCVLVSEIAPYNVDI